jgi:transposase-like protein
MHSQGFELLFQQLATLSAEQVARLSNWLADIGLAGRCADIIEQSLTHHCCPHCGADKVQRYGQANGLRRFRCTCCRRTYNALTGTPLAHLRQRDKWLPYLQCLLDSRSVRDAAATVGVHRTTSFRWRHRLLSGIKQQRPTHLSGVAEVDETYLLESQKGSRHLTRPARKRGGVAHRPGISREQDCILVVRDRNKQTLDFVTGRGPVTKAQLLTCLQPVLAADILLISDGAAAYGAFALAAGITHTALNLRAGMRSRGAIHIQNVNAWHSRFKGWLCRFHGVASRYLSNYTGWQRVMDSGLCPTPSRLLQAAIANR